MKQTGGPRVAKGRSRRFVVSGVSCILGFSTATAFGQALVPDLPTAPSMLRASVKTEAPEQTDDATVRDLPKRIFWDEVHVVTSPAHLHKRDLVWLAPLTGAAVASFATDTRTSRDVVSHDPGFNTNNANVSDGLRDGFLIASPAFFAVGQLAHNDHARETGVLAGEAIVDAYAFGAVAKVITLRERPKVDNENGAFFQKNAGWDSSFPSGHSIVSWASAAVLAGEYSKPWQQAGLYAGATAVSLTRVLAQQHFPSDVLIGAAAGWLIGHYVYRAHHGHGRSR